MIFLGFLFVTVFMVLSMFFAILGDAQGTVLQEKEEKEAKRKLMAGPQKREGPVERLRLMLLEKLRNAFPSLIPGSETPVEPVVEPEDCAKGSTLYTSNETQDWITAAHHMQSLVCLIEKETTSPEDAPVLVKDLGAGQTKENSKRSETKLQGSLGASAAKRNSEVVCGGGTKFDSKPKSGEDFGKGNSDVAARVTKKDAKPLESEQGYGAHLKKVHAAVKFIMRTEVQLVLYIGFLASFHALLFKCRDYNEFYLSNNIKAIFITNAFDADHNELMDIRRISDIWEWNDNAFIPGLFSNSPGGENWPDGTGPFSQDGANTYSAMALAEQAHVMAPLGGIQLRQVRQAPSPPQMGSYRPLYKAFEDDGTELDTAPYGAAGHNFMHWGAHELGGPVAYSPSIVSTATYPGDGYVAYILPFFSPVKLPDEEGNSTHPVTDFRPYATSKELKRFYCVRTSTNGVDMKQTCDTDPSTNVVRNAAAQLMRDLKEGHWIDFQTRMVDITIQFNSANSGLEAHLELYFEFPSAGGVLPSFMIKTRRTEPDSSMRSDLTILSVYVSLFIVLEVLQIWQIGIKAYVTKFWNYLDWANYIIFFVSADFVARGFLDKAAVDPCTISETVGFSNDWRSMEYFVDAKQLLAINATLQVLKVTKFCNVLVPRMSMLANVLVMASVDLLFFGVTFGISLLAFADCFYVNLGSNIGSYYSFTRSIISLLRSLFGDFDIDEIDDNSPSQTNSYVFLAYLFAAVFILLSMVFAILGEAQGQVIAASKELASKKRPKKRRTWSQKLIEQWQTIQSYLSGTQNKVIPVDAEGSQVEDEEAKREDEAKKQKSAKSQTYHLTQKVGTMLQHPATSMWVQQLNAPAPPLARDMLSKAYAELCSNQEKLSQVEVVLRLLRQSKRISSSDARTILIACGSNRPLEMKATPAFTVMSALAVEKLDTARGHDTVEKM